MLYVCAQTTWSCQKLHCCCCWLWTQSLSWIEGDGAHFCTRGSSPSLAGFLHQTRYLANLRKRATEWSDCVWLKDCRSHCISEFVCCTWEQVVIVTVAVRAGAGVGAAGSLPLPGCRQQGQLRGTDRALAHPCPTVGSIPVLGGTSWPFGGSGHFLVLFGEEDRCPTAHLWSQDRRGHTQILRERAVHRLKCKPMFIMLLSFNITIFMLHNNLTGRTFSTNLLAAAFSTLIVVSRRGWVMGEGRTPVSSSHRLPAPHAGASFPLVRELSLDDTDLLSQSFGSTRLTNAVLSRADLVEARLQVMQLLLKW